VGAGVIQGVHALLDRPAEGLAWLGDKVGLNPLVGTPSYQQQVAQDAATRAAYEKQYGSNPYAQGGNLATQVAGTWLPLAGIGRAVGAAGNALLGASLPARITTGGLSAASQGAAAAGLTAGASDNPLLSQMGQGAGMGLAAGAAAPVVGAVGRYGANLARSAADYALGGEGAADRTARAAIQRFAGGNPLFTDPREIVPGSLPTMADATGGNTGIARLEKTAQNDPVIGEQFRERQRQNAAARVAELERVAGDNHALETAIQARSRITPDFTQAHQVDPQPVLNAIDAEMNGPGGRELALRQKLNQVRGLLVDPNGELRPEASDPEYLYQSVRKSLGNIMSGMDPNGQRGAVASNVLRVLDRNIQPALDRTIESGTPGFQQYLADYSAASRPIDAMKVLQGLNITDSQGRITLQKVQSALDKIETATSARTRGIKAEQSVNQPQLETLRNIRDDLLRRDAAFEAAKARGSDSVQNLASERLAGAAVGNNPLAQAAVRIPARFLGPLVGAGIGAAEHGGGIGASALAAGAGSAVGEIMHQIGLARNNAARERLAELLLNPAVYAAGPQTSAIGRIGQAAINPLLTGARQLQPIVIPSAVEGNRLLQPAPTR
jgi:hypothetical protein